MPDLGLQEDSPGPNPPNTSGDAERDFFDAGRAEHSRRMRLMELGWIGRPFGGGAEKQANIAVFVILVCLGVAAIIVWRVDLVTHSDTALKDLTPFTSIVTLALGYIFGSNKKAD